MRGILASVVAFAMVGSALAQGWMLKNPYEAKSKFAWKVTVTASVGGQDVEASMKQMLTVDSKSEKEIKAKGNWSDIMVNGNEQDGNDASWDVVMNPNGSISSAGESADYARMLAPAAFVYPEKEVKVGDKWTTKYKPAKDAKDVTVDYEVLASEKVGDMDALKIKGKLKEEGGTMTSDGTYWIGKDGKLLKFDLDLKNWIVPMAGAQEIDAKVKGEIVKDK